MPQPYIDEMVVTHYNDATGSGTIADPYVPKVAVTGLDVSSLQVTNDENNPVPVTANNLPLPTGAATSANQSTANTSLSNIDSKLPALSNGKIPVEVGSLNVSVNNASLEIANDVGNPVPISAASLPLPSGAATSANRSTANTSLASIDGKIPALGQALASGSVPVVLPDAQITTLTPPTSVGITGTPTFNIGTAPSLSISTLPALATGTNNITYDRILEAFNQRNTSNIISYLGVLKGGNVLSGSSYDKLINLLQKTQLDPDYQPKVLLSEAELARFDLVLVNEIEDLI